MNLDENLFGAILPDSRRLTLLRIGVRLLILYLIWRRLGVAN